MFAMADKQRQRAAGSQRRLGGAARRGRSREEAQGIGGGVPMAMAGMQQQQWREQRRREGEQERADNERASGMNKRRALGLLPTLAR
jgi:hypothetical protein